MAPVVDRLTGQMMGSPDNPFMLARDLALGDNDDPENLQPPCTHSPGKMLIEGRRRREGLRLYESVDPD